jgi:hypothetical protein
MMVGDTTIPSASGYAYHARHLQSSNPLGFHRLKWTTGEHKYFGPGGSSRSGLDIVQRHDRTPVDRGARLISAASAFGMEIADSSQLELFG